MRYSFPRANAFMRTLTVSATPAPRRTSGNRYRSPVARRADWGRKGLEARIWNGPRQPCRASGKRAGAVSPPRGPGFARRRLRGSRPASVSRLFRSVYPGFAAGCDACDKSGQTIDRIEFDTGRAGR